MSINAFCLSGLDLLSPAGRVAFGDIRNPRIVNTCILAHFRDVVEHLNKASNTIKQGTQSFWFRVHIKSKVYTILWPINCTGALDVKKKKRQCTYLTLKIHYRWKLLTTHHLSLRGVNHRFAGGGPYLQAVKDAVSAKGTQHTRSACVHGQLCQATGHPGAVLWPPCPHFSFYKADIVTASPGGLYDKWCTLGSYKNT